MSDVRCLGYSIRRQWRTYDYWLHYDTPLSKAICGGFYKMSNYTNWSIMVVDKFSKEVYAAVSSAKSFDTEAMCEIA